MHLAHRNNSDITIYILQHETSPLWPQFQNASRLEKTILMPELVSKIDS